MLSFYLSHQFLSKRRIFCHPSDGLLLALHGMTLACAAHYLQRVNAKRKPSTVRSNIDLAVSDIITNLLPQVLSLEYTHAYACICIGRTTDIATSLGALATALRRVAAS